ncbi:MFS transporter [Kineosporia rhizophila]|uniref:MFS transporter n=1 Tax=Kineosporia rhizophila TaxID=84633 RepID=UPI001E3B2989|nr:MFS transporter [Kineosporia rhizophila]MCE0536373.1 MFS transporter [Kineosporia rhizophila]
MPRSTDRRVSPLVIFAVLASATASISLLQSLVTPVLPTIQADLNTSTTTVTWVITAWLLTASVATPLLGRVGDMAGKKRTLLIALAAIAIGSAVAAAAPSVSVLILGRVLQGIGAAVFPLTFAIIRDEFPPHRLPGAVGAIAAVIATGGGAGVVLAGPVVENLSWRWLFWIPAIAASVIWLLALRLVPESAVRTPGKVNVVAAALLSGWLVCLLLPVTKGNAWGWTSASVLGGLALAAVLLATWIWVELRSSTPLIDMRMMRLPAVWTTNLVALLFGAAMFVTYAFLPVYMQVPVSTGYGFGASVTGAGLLLLPMLVGMAVLGFASGPISRLVSAKTQLVGGAVLLTLSGLILVLAHDARWQVSLAAGIAGVGMGLAFSSMVNLVVNGVPPEQTGVASGMNTNLRTIGGSIGTAVVSSIIASHTTSGGLPAESGFTSAFILMTVLAAVAVGAALLVPTRTRIDRRTVVVAEEDPAVAVATS